MERAHLERRDLDRLAAAGALAELAGHRHRAAWEALGAEAPLPLLGRAQFSEAEARLSPPTEGKDLVADYRTMGLRLGRHPLELLRPRLARMRLGTAEDPQRKPHGRYARAVGLVINRQRPSTASGVIFMTLEDETGFVNVVVWPWVARMAGEPLEDVAHHPAVHAAGELVALRGGEEGPGGTTVPSGSRMRTSNS